MRFVFDVSQPRERFNFFVPWFHHKYLVWFIFFCHTDSTALLNHSMANIAQSYPFLNPGEASHDVPQESHELKQLRDDHSASTNSMIRHSNGETEKGSRQRTPWYKWWQLELVRVLLAVACLIAIMGILLGFQNRLLSAWPYRRFSLNSVIALRATITRTAMMFPVTACIGQRKWQWFLPSKRRTAAAEPPERLFSDFEIFDESFRGLLGSLKLLRKINIR